jgi:ribosomal protein L15
LIDLIKIIHTRPDRVGRGYGSTRGSHTTGRGAKGDKARGATRLTFDGTKIKKSWIQRTPRLRGKNRLKVIQDKPVVVTLTQLDKWFKSGQTVDIKSLAKKTGTNSTLFKILATGKLTKKLKVSQVLMSEAAKAKFNE